MGFSKSCSLRLYISIISEAPMLVLARNVTTCLYACHQKEEEKDRDAAKNLPYHSAPGKMPLRGLYMWVFQGRLWPSEFYFILITTLLHSQLLMLCYTALLFRGPEDLVVFVQPCHFPSEAREGRLVTIEIPSPSMKHHQAVPIGELIQCCFILMTSRAGKRPCKGSSGYGKSKCHLEIVVDN